MLNTMYETSSWGRYLEGYALLHESIRKLQVLRDGLVELLLGDARCVEVPLEKKEPRGLARRYDREPDLVEERQALARIREKPLLPVAGGAGGRIVVLPEGGAFLEDDAGAVSPRLSACTRPCPRDGGRNPAVPGAL